jgi:hypothetical protein
MGTVVAADDPPGIAGVGIVVEAKELGGEGAGNEERGLSRDTRIHWRFFSAGVNSKKR